VVAHRPLTPGPRGGQPEEAKSLELADGAAWRRTSQRWNLPAAECKLAAHLGLPYLS